jgi:hypothetical protein
MSMLPHPLGVWQAAAFQWLNPKAWVFAIALVVCAAGPVRGHSLPRSPDMASDSDDGVGLSRPV